MTQFDLLQDEDEENIVVDSNGKEVKTGDDGVTMREKPVNGAPGRQVSYVECVEREKEDLGPVIISNSYDNPSFDTFKDELGLGTVLDQQGRLSTQI